MKTAWNGISVGIRWNLEIPQGSNWSNPGTLWGGPAHQWTVHWPYVANRAMTSFTSLGPSADCMGLAQVAKYQGQTSNARAAIFPVSQRGFSSGWGLQGKVAWTPHQSIGRRGTVCTWGLLSRETQYTIIGINSSEWPVSRWCLSVPASTSTASPCRGATEWG